MTTADLTSTPWRPALATADNSSGIVASTTAHGEATIMKVIARRRQLVTAAPKVSGIRKTVRVAKTMPIE
ncbi:hypothetical protein I7331_32125 [Frankia sp. AgB1.8]|nr:MULTISPECIES: hypothetical protein [unclassified Frankia]MBL7623814.1 hypothetical protein [Frankia sp. AgB1.8]